MVIVIAVIVGGLISAFCIGVIVYMVVKAIRKRKEKGTTDPEGREGILKDSPAEGEQDDEDHQRRKKTTQPQVLGLDVE